MISDHDNMCSSNELFEQFKKEVSRNRKANEFRNATNDLLKANQIVLTVTVDPCTNKIIYTGENSIIAKIDEKNCSKMTLQDIEHLMLKTSYDENAGFKFCELDGKNQKKYQENEPVAKLPKLKINPSSNDWTAVIGRKVVESFMKDIKDREHLGYNTNKDKIPKWYPNDVRKIYASNLDKDASKKVMKAILGAYPEIEEVYKVWEIPFVKQNHQKNKFEQAHSDSPAKRLNIMKKLSLNKTPQTVKTNLQLRDIHPKNHDDLRKKLVYQRMGLEPKEGWNVWVCKKKFQLDNENHSRKM